MASDTPDVRKSWAFYWLTGQREVLTGVTVADALNRAGYGAGALRALDFYGDADQADAWAWDPDTRNWVKR